MVSDGPLLEEPFSLSVSPNLGSLLSFVLRCPIFDSYQAYPSHRNKPILAILMARAVHKCAFCL